MGATLIVGMLCVHLLCFGAMFLLISTRLHGRKMGMEVFAIGNFLLGCAYVLQLAGGAPGWNAMSVVNHTLTLCAPAVYAVGAMRFFGRAAPLWPPLLTLAVAYTAAQVVAQWTLGTAARYAMLAGASALLFAAMTATVIQGARSFAKDLRVEMVLFAALIGGIFALNAMKFVFILQNGLEALDMDSRFQTVFYLYMSFLATVLAPSIIWLVLRRLTDELRATAAHDPLTRLLNRRGLLDGLQAHFRSRKAGPAHLLIVDIDHFKRINDSHGHQVGDTVLCHVADLLRDTARQGDLTCRLGGEEFVVICLDTDAEGALRLASRARTAIENSDVAAATAPGSPIRCTVTIGISAGFAAPQELDRALQEADAALYRGKHAGRNRVEASDAAAQAGSAMESALHAARAAH
ncbi:diguanylate cyclase [Acidovorax sp. Leaf76]|uniref:GGDEF domain-containing protein n=1 Tax=unclassified Acidovorax TaxID=2684926 RepID=UPI0006F9E14B|nr:MULTISPECIES: GGDEF domain-containing protein [unclassified Acidovorax]KQO23755.1 diguanylate cyclase [Acidovorax sp. Leaf76]KQO35570.1 diguanylate cyclase [Acidovorax sp. Leaf84]KQS37896.1 diguanylate cyclase [Acidovorax sp. Leaf191]